MTSSKKRLILLGSTGSIGLMAEQTAANLGYGVAALAAGGNIRELERQIRLFRPEIAAVWDEAAAAELRELTRDCGVKILCGMEGLCEAASAKADIALNAIVGAVGLQPTLAALNGCGRVALANKESLVSGGSLIMSEARRKNAELIPVDSEHSAIHQALRCGGAGEVRRLILTASGGPFYGLKTAEMRDKTPADIVHPTWKMGVKITVDSSTMMNKGLEVIEASRLFGVPGEKIEIMVHRQSIVHSMAEFADGSVIAQLGLPDMRTPIQYALTYPERVNGLVRPLMASDMRTLTFEDPDTENFGCIELAYAALKRGGTAPAVLNAANERAVEHFLRGRIRFTDIEETVRAAMSELEQEEPAKPDGSLTLTDILRADAEARKFADAWTERFGIGPVMGREVRICR